MEGNQPPVSNNNEGADKKLLEDEGYDSNETIENGTKRERDSNQAEGDSTASGEETTKLSVEDDVFTEENLDDVKKPRSKVVTVILIIIRLILLLTILYFFICSLDLLSDGFKLIGGRAAGDIFANNPLLSNPLCGLMIGVVATAFLQSSSTSTSIVITMVAAGLLTVQLAIPIVMGANIGTSVTGIIVSVSQAGDRRAFRRAFSAATVHDMFNWLTVLVLLPVEVITGYLYRVTSAIVDATNMAEGQAEVKFLSVLIKPVTDLVVQIDDEVLEEIATGNPAAANMSLLKYWCKTESVPADHPGTPVYPHLEPAPEVDPTKIIGVKECVYIFHGTNMSEQLVGLLVLLMALFLLIFCLVLMVKVLKSLLQGSMAGVIQKTINADFPGRAACLTGYLAILVGAVITILVQSSSVVASALTPLVGIGLVTVERVFPMMLGANIGTTSTALLAAFATSGDKMVSAFQIALCHLFFNLTGILIWYPIPFMRRVPIKLARFLGRITSKYRWFAAMYILIMFFIAPLIVFALSIPGWYVLAAVGIPFILLIVTILIVKLLQDKKPEWLPGFLRTWEFLPEPLRSLEPLDRQVTKLVTLCSCCKCCAVIDKSLDKYEIGRRLSVFETVEDSIEDFRKFANITVAKDASVPIKVSPLANANFESNV